MNATVLLDQALQINKGIISVDWLVEYAFTQGVPRMELRKAAREMGIKHDSIGKLRFVFKDQAVWDEYKEWISDVAAWNDRKAATRAEDDGDPAPFNDDAWMYTPLV